MIESLVLKLTAAAGAIAYGGAAAYLLSGLKSRRVKRSDEPTISIVIPVRNEEHTLPTLLESLRTIDYPAQSTEIIVVNDQSTDRTRDIAEGYSDMMPCAFRIIDVETHNESLAPTKTRPLAQGIECATHEFVLMTDADCVVPPGWARGIVHHFTNGVGMVCGITRPASRNGHSQLFNKFERADWYYLLGVAAGFSGRGKPQALIGNNYAVRRATYERLGGFRKMPFNRIDDLSLMSAIRAEGQETVVMPVEPELVVETQPVASFSDLVTQRQRWLRAWPHTDLKVRLALIAGFLAHVTIPLWPFVFGWMFLPLLTVIVLADVAVVMAMRARCRDHSDTGSAWFYPFFACAYGTALLVNILFKRRIRWKERDF